MQGKFYEGCIEGHGKILLVGGGFFEGEFKRGVVNGPGIFKITKGEVYKVSGYFQQTNGELELIGNGVLEISGENGYHYSGGLKNTFVMHGQGVQNFASGAKYEGQFINGLFHGHGSFTLKEGDTCEGEWENDMLKGVGKGVKNDQKVSGIMDKPASFTFITDR
ncbi:MAG: hypothetical protein JKY92_03355 [Magnetovibrio sp.]|nr:hypothetical protein [Magnetovibrio sp.]